MAELPTRKFNPKSIKRSERNYVLKHVCIDKKDTEKFAEIEHGLKRHTIISEVSSSEILMAFGVFVRK
jgi:hypothetical protein